MGPVPGGVRRDKRRGRAGRRRGAVLIGALLFCLLASGCSWQTKRVDLDPRPPAQTSWVLAADGPLLTQLHADEDREIVTLATMPKVLVDAVVDIEDSRFFEHTGVDLKAVLRAIKANATNGRVVEGGSTITQQYVKNTFVGDDRSAKRKIEEARAAWDLEHKLTKSRILELYLNTIYFGNGSYGVQAASRQYFGTTVDKLTLAQAALLAGVIRPPASLDPFAHPDAAVARRREVLNQMADVGSITKTDADPAAAQPLALRDRSADARYPVAYFVEEAKRF